MDILPATLEEAIDILKTFNSKFLPEIKTMSEEAFIVDCHFSLGMFLRNVWFLWWHEGHGCKEWPKEKPKLNEWLNSKGIVHADDMSSIILISFYRSVCGLDINLEEQINKYKEHWKKEGFPDGIYKPNKK